MSITVQSIQLINDGTLRVEGAKGAVTIQRRAGQIEAHYQGNQLVNGSAHAYAKQRLEEAIELTTQFPFPWRIETDGTQRITDHKSFYEQSFSPDLLGIETLRRWLSNS